MIKTNQFGSLLYLYTYKSVLFCRLKVIVMEVRGLKSIPPNKIVYCTMEVDGCDKLQTDQAEASKPWYVLRYHVCYYISVTVNSIQLNSALNKYSAITDMAAQFRTIQIFAVECGEYLSLMHFYSVTFANIAVNHLLPKTTFFGL